METNKLWQSIDELRNLAYLYSSPARLSRRCIGRHVVWSLYNPLNVDCNLGPSVQVVEINSKILHWFATFANLVQPLFETVHCTLVCFSKTIVEQAFGLIQLSTQPPNERIVRFYELVDVLEVQLEEKATVGCSQGNVMVGRELYRTSTVGALQNHVQSDQQDTSHIACFPEVGVNFASFAITLEIPECGEQCGALGCGVKRSGWSIVDRYLIAFWDERGCGNEKIVSL